MKYNIIFKPMGKKGAVRPDRTVLDCARQLSLDIVSTCGGAGTCGQCKIVIQKGRVSDITPEEKALLSPKEIENGCRLACRVKPLSHIEIRLLPESMTAPMRTQVEGMAISVTPDLDLTQYSIVRPIGLAVDLGTTKIACYLLDLASGNLLAAGGIMNPLIAYGDDLIARLDRARVPDQGKTMQTHLVKAINLSAKDLCTRAGMRTGDIVEMVVAGNTAMHHLFAGLRVDSLLTVPYTPEVVAPLDIKAADLDLNMAPKTHVHLLPNIAGYVGGDHVAMILSTGISTSDKTILALDIGTNTEVCLVNRGNMVSVSCASGPAFEGGGTRQGMRGADGAIEHIRIDKEQVIYHTIGNGPPRGICGSGMLDALAQLYTAGIIDSGGKFLDHPRIKVRNRIKEFILAEKRDTSLEEPVSITQRDIRALQLAKGAIQAGIEILMKDRGITRFQIDEVVIAGAFGTYIDVTSAITIGMLPSLPLDQFTQVGNAAGAGAKMALISRKKRDQAAHIARKANYLELGGTQVFMDTFVNALKIG